MEKIGFFGGCFNPITNVHIEIAKNLIDSGKVNKIVFIPVNDYYKKEKLVNAKHRYNMIEIAIKNLKKILVDDIEIKEEKSLFAIDAFELIENKYKNESNKKKLYMIMGSDNYNKISGWKSYDKIIDKYKIIVVDRDEKIISSTQIRNMIKNNDDNVKEYLPKEVYKYIKENNLYKEN